MQLTIQANQHVTDPSHGGQYRLIENVVNSLSGVAPAMEEGSPADANGLRTVVEFLQIDADQLHHGKEEAQLFPFLIQRGVPPGGSRLPDSDMNMKKDATWFGRSRRRSPPTIKANLKPPEALIQNLRSIVDLYHNHIWKEDAMVFPMAERVLSDADKEDLGQKFVEVDRAIGLDVVARLERFAKSLAPTAAQ